MANAIKKYPVPLIFKKILKDLLSGELLITTDRFSKTLFFQDGRLAYAISTVKKEQLGEMLVADRKITPSQLEQALQIQKAGTHKDRRLGDILVKYANLDKRDYYYTLKNQVRLIALSTFPLDQGEWKFVVKTPEIPNPHSFKIKLPEIIHEGVMLLRDISYFKKKLFYRAPVTTAISEAVFQFLTSEEIKLYTDLTGLSNTSMEQVMIKFGAAGNDPVNEEKFWKTIITMYLLNVVDFVEFIVDEDLNKNVEDLYDLYGKINTRGLNYYQLLGLGNSAPVEEVKKSYFDFSRKHHPDRINAAPDSTTMLKANAVFAEINKAFEVLSNNQKKNEYDARGFKESHGVEVGPSEKGKNARDLYLNANRLYKTKRYFEAVSLLEQAVAIDNSRATYFLLLGLAQAKLPAMKKQAEANLKKASEIEPWNADPVFALGELYRSENLLKNADYYFKKALEINMEHTLAGQAVKDLEKYLGHGKKPLFSLFGKKK